MELNELLEISITERFHTKAIQIRCCTAAGCLSSNSQAVKDNLDVSVKAAGLEKRL
jgi:bidirectional [NiFe] hydrogenase diaphorase subunit